ncbi:MAG TPA: ABC transporter permease subunit [Blastocatellia bacterium]|nr:ABC transporter permease subunit [Blastocatellia bacterium]
MKVLPIALNTFRESVRDRVLYNLIFFVLLLVGASVFLSELSLSQETKIIVDIGLSAMRVFGVLIAIFIGIGLVYKEIDKRTIYSLLAKPISRSEFILGKYFGLCLTLLVNTAVMAVAIALALAYVKGGVDAMQARIMPTAYLIFLELMVMTAIALLFSSFSSPALSALMAFFLFLIGSFSADLKLFAATVSSNLIKALAQALYYLLPNLANFNYITSAAHGQAPPANMIAASTLYAALYISALLAATILIFQKRNFK